jgi:dihydroorotase
MCASPLAVAGPLLLLAVVAGAAVTGATATEAPYDLLLRGGHVIDPKSGTSAVRDVAIAGGRIAAVAARIDPALAFKVVDAAGLYVTPGLIDLHVHVYTGTGEKGSYAGDNSVYPDGFTLRSGVTTVVDAGCAGWLRRLQDRVIDRSARACSRCSTSSATACGEGSGSRTWTTCRRSRPRTWP